MMKKVLIIDGNDLEATKRWLEEQLARLDKTLGRDDGCIEIHADTEQVIGVTWYRLPISFVPPVKGNRVATTPKPSRSTLRPSQRGGGRPVGCRTLRS